MFTAVYRKIFPYKLRKKIYDVFLGDIVFVIRNFRVIAKGKCTYVFQRFLSDTEENRAFSFIGRYGITSYPHPYSLEYREKQIQVELDKEKNLPFVMHHGNRLYFPDRFSIDKVKKDYRALLIEQDERAAHRYVRSYRELQGRTLLDIGAAEGIFALDTIHFVKHVIIFECMDYWQKPLQATFAPWPDKVTVVEKYVGNKTEGDFIKIDDFLSGKSNDNLFLKMDIEGAERMALEGARQTLSNGKDIQLAVCTYHRKRDPEYMETLLTGLGYQIEFSEGLMYWNKRVSKGVIRAKKS
ncbi:MAG: FkbM family methyltransferase [Cyclobacteriaceae bacterium]